MKQIILSAMFMLLASLAQSQTPLSEGAICISGRCKDGNGRLRLPNFEGREFEGKFVKGIPLRSTKVYNKDGWLLYYGDLEDYLPSGQGEKYARSSAGKDYLSEQGYFSDGFFIEGVAYDENNTVLVKGTFVKDSTHRQLTGYKLVTTPYRGRKVYAQSSNMRTNDEKGNYVYHGEIYFDENPLSDSNLPIARVKYEKGVRNGISEEYDTSYTLRYVISFKNGVPANDAYIYSHIGSVVRRIGAGDVTDADGGPLVRMVSGKFSFDGVVKELSYPEGGTIEKFRELYDAAPVPEKPDYAFVPDHLKSAQSSVPASVNSGDMKDLLEYMTKINEDMKDVTALIGTTTRRNYDAVKKQVDSKRSEAISRLESLIKMYKGAVSNKMFADLEKMLKLTREGYQMPAYIINR